MIGRIRRSIGAQILLLAAVNLILLIAIGLAASGMRVPLGMSEMVMQLADSRLQDVTRRIALDLERAQPGNADAVIERYATDYDTRFVLVRNDGTRIAGSELAIPAQVKQVLSGPGPQGRAGLHEEMRFGRPPKKGPPQGRPDGRPLPPPDQFGPPGAEPGLRMPQTPAHFVRAPGDPRFWIVLRLPVRFAGQTEIVPGSLLVAPYRFFGDRLLFPLSGLLWVFLALGVTLICWWPMLRSITKSLGKMEHATGEIAQGRFSAVVDVARSDEIGRLSASIEQMAGRLGAMVSGQKRFLGDTAHELRSPVGRMQIALEILDTRVGESERAYVRDLREDVESLRHLTDALLQYARAALGDGGRLLQPVALSPIIEQSIAREGRGATFTATVDPRTVVNANAALLERAVSNVIRNAATYAGSAGPIHVNATEDRGQVVISVTDQGPGVAPESLPRLFEPFYREDAARDAKTGGTGLGLAIVRSAIEACGGSVSCHLPSPHGLEVRMILQSGR
jgi:two-component system sensor histidine kinase CpxA